MARILTLTPNPAIDVTYTVGRQIVGETLRVTDVQRRPGGKGLNVARVLHALARDVAALHPLGGSAGRWIERELSEAGPPALTCRIAGETRTTVAVVDGIAHPTLLAEPGPTLAEDEWERLLDATRDAVAPGGWVVVAGSFPGGVSPTHVHILVRAVHGRGGRILVDTSGLLLRAAAEAGADVVKANEHEIQEAVGDDDASRAVDLLGRNGSTVLMSRGHRGALLRSPDGDVRIQAAVPDVEGNPTGAGDAATAGFVAALAEGHDLTRALQWAALTGAAAVLSPVAGEIDVASLPELGRRAGLPAAALLAPHPLEPRSS